MLQDLRYAFRTLVANPGFTIVAVLCLSLGIGVNGTIFSVVDGVLLQPYPFPDAERIVVLNSTNPKQDITPRRACRIPITRTGATSRHRFRPLAAFQGRSLTISDGTSEPERFLGAAVSSTLFGLLGTPPALGRDFGPADDRLGAEPVVLLSDDLWRRRYAADPSVVGRSITVNGRPAHGDRRHARRASGSRKRSGCGSRSAPIASQPGATAAARRYSRG